MTSQPEALRLADALNYHDDPRLYEEADVLMMKAAAELRRLHELNEELLAREKRWSELADVEVARCDKLQAINGRLLEVLELALRSRGVMLLSDPPQDAWKTYGVEAKAHAAIAAARKTI